MARTMDSFEYTGREQAVRRFIDGHTLEGDIETVHEVLGDVLAEDICDTISARRRTLTFIEDSKELLERLLKPEQGYPSVSIEATDFVADTEAIFCELFYRKIDKVLTSRGIQMGLPRDYYDLDKLVLLVGEALDPFISQAPPSGAEENGKKRLVTSDNVEQIINELLDLPFWPTEIKTETCYGVQTDDTDGDPNKGWLQLYFTCDGDVHITQSVQAELPDAIRFRTLGGGGSHLRVRNTCLILAMAIKKDMEGKGDWPWEILED